MTIINGEFQPEPATAILDAMIEDAKDHFGQGLNDNELAVIRTFYTPIADRLAETQEDIGLVLSSAQIDNASGRALDLLTALIGVTRIEAQPAVGEVTFSRETAGTTDYTIPRNTIVQTDSQDPVRFRTQETAVLETGQTEITVPIAAETGGVDSNIGSNTIRIMPQPPTGIDFVNNDEPTRFGLDRESDTELRERAQNEVSSGASSTAKSLISSVQLVPGVRSASIFINDGIETDNDGLPPHSFELVVDGGDEDEVGQLILEKKAAGTMTHGGTFGTNVTVQSQLPNGQEYDVSFSRPNNVQIYANISVEITDDYVGDDALTNAIVREIGGTLTSGNAINGNLSVGDDVLSLRLSAAVMSVQGVYDIEHLRFSAGSPPTSSDTGNISISVNDVAYTDALDGSIVVNTTEV